MFTRCLSSLASLTGETVLIVNPGSVGQPRSGDARASYAVWDDGEFILRKARYPVETTIAKLKLLGFKETVEQKLTATLLSRTPE